MVGALIVGVLVLTTLFGLPLLLAIVDAVVVVLAAFAGLAARVFLRRPWTVEATAGEERHARQVVGWRAAGRAALSWADELKLGRDPASWDQRRGSRP